VELKRRTVYDVHGLAQVLAPMPQFGVTTHVSPVWQLESLVHDPVRSSVLAQKKPPLTFVKQAQLAVPPQKSKPPLQVGPDGQMVPERAQSVPTHVVPVEQQVSPHAVPGGHPHFPSMQGCPLGQQVEPHALAPGLRHAAAAPLQVPVVGLAQATPDWQHVVPQRVVPAGQPH
jgi:hypothetical protein